MNLHSPDVQITSSDEALTLLKEGNARFVAGEGMPRNTNLKDRELTAEAQKPFAAIVTCADSRCAPELYFDQKIGDIFVLRNAGNIADDSVIGSLEFGVAVLGVQVVIVVGHTQCGAVHNAHADATGLPAKLQGVLDTIKPGIAANDCKEDAVNDNVKVQMDILANSETVSKVPVLGANYDVATGKVTFL